MKKIHSALKLHFFLFFAFFLFVPLFVLFLSLSFRISFVQFSLLHQQPSFFFFLLHIFSFFFIFSFLFLCFSIYHLIPYSLFVVGFFLISSRLCFCAVKHFSLLHKMTKLISHSAFTTRDFLDTCNVFRCLSKLAYAHIILISDSVRLLLVFPAVVFIID